MTRDTALIAATLVLLAAAIVPRILAPWPLWARAAWRLTALVVLTFLVQLVLGSPISPQFHTGPGSWRLWEQVVETGWWVVAAQSAIGLARVFIVLETRPRETQIISDLVAGAIYLVTVLAIVNFVFEVPIGGLLATSGVIAIVLGLALQSSLADVFSGIAVGIERPYKAGDLLWVEGGIEGRVVEVNWRSTHIATIRKDVAIVPNSVMAKARLINHSLPTTIRGDSVSVRLDPRAAPEQCMAALTAAATACLLPLDLPERSVSRTELHGDGAVYEISFSVASSETIMAARTEMYGQVQRHLHHAGIALAVAGVARVVRTAIPTPADLLAESDWFGVLADADRDLLAEHLTSAPFAAGEILIRQDDTPQSLFIIASGVVEITRTADGESRRVYRMSPGGSIGAVALITGSPYAATATALTAVKAYRLDGEAIAAAMAARPELATGLETLAKRGQGAMHGSDVVAHESDQSEPSDMFLSRLRGFLSRLSVGDVD